MLFQFRDSPLERTQPFFDFCVSMTTGDHFAGQYLRETRDTLLEIAKSLINLATKAINVLAQILPFPANLLKEAQRMVLRFGHYRSSSRTSQRYALSQAG